MKQQIFVIHGGNASPTYDEYLDYLRNKQVTLEGLASKDGKSHLQQELGDAYIVYQPTMPNRKYARYLEWKIWFEKYIPFFEDDVILIGHSLGGIFLAKYLSEETITKKIRATILVAAPYNRGAEPMADFLLPESLEKMEQQAGDIFLYHSKNDPIVPFQHLEEYQRALPRAHALPFENQGHFIEEIFPEMTEGIRKLAQS